MNETSGTHDEEKKASASNALILMGIKHCGKSTQGRLLSKHFACPFFDTDDKILEMTGKSPREIYTEQGEAEFIAAEEKACGALKEKLSMRTSASKPYSAVIATGGGVCKNEKALAILRDLGTLIFLNAEEKTAADRIVREAVVGEDGSLSNLPAYIAKDEPKTLEHVRVSFHRFYEERTKKYSAICDLKVDMTSAPPETNMERVLRSLRQKNTTTR